MIGRTKSLPGKTIRVLTGCGYMYVTVNFKDDKPFEVFLNIGKAGGCASGQAETLGRLSSLCLRNGIDCADIAEQLASISCHIPVPYNTDSKTLSCSDAVAKALEEIIKTKEIIDANSTSTNTGD